MVMVISAMRDLGFARLLLVDFPHEMIHFLLRMHSRRASAVDDQDPVQGLEVDPLYHVTVRSSEMRLKQGEQVDVERDLEGDH